jgi:hypothetical protein
MSEKHDPDYELKYIIEKSYDKQKWEPYDNAASEESAMLIASYYARHNPMVRYRYRPAITLHPSEITTCLERN